MYTVTVPGTVKACGKLRGAYLFIDWTYGEPGERLVTAIVGNRSWL